ncbi:hypothetical protein EGW08_000839 [Elysia chlorotica]|uniref:RabBD domain-containing protein n=1 Tax=Elysia chlorotica TaxID=188477 RepID=A0A3S1BU75_ELYCH|nr:hypothetical protein EGW08_000839 [Elysia chlorotica]
MGKKKKKKNKKGSKASEDAGGEESKSEAGEPAAAAAAGGDKDSEKGDASSPTTAPAPAAASVVGGGGDDKKSEDGGSDAGGKTMFRSEGRPEVSKSRIPPLHNYTLDLTCLTPEEEHALQHVLERDEAEWRPIHNHVQVLRNELNMLYKGFGRKPGKKPKCVRCHWTYGLWRRRCQRCRHKTCRRCIHKQANGKYWCGPCVRLREIKHLTGEWMVPPATRLHSSDLIRVSLKDKEKYQWLHASREKKKQDLLAKLNALHGKKKIDTTGIGSFSLWSSDPTKDDKKKKKKKKGKKKKGKDKKKGKKKKKKKDKDNNAIPLEGLADTNTSFLAVDSTSFAYNDRTRASKTVSKLSNDRERNRANKPSSGGRSERHRTKGDTPRSRESSSSSSSSSSGTSDSSSDSEDSGGSFSSGYQSSGQGDTQKQRARTVQSRGLKAEPVAECSTVKAKVRSTETRLRVTDEEFSERFSRHDDDYCPYFDKQDMDGLYDGQFYAGDNEDFYMDEYVEEKSSEQKNSVVVPVPDLNTESKKGATVEGKKATTSKDSEDWIQQKLKERFINNALKDNLMFDSVVTERVGKHVRPVVLEDRQNNRRHNSKSRDKTTHSVVEYRQLDTKNSQSHMSEQKRSEKISKIKCLEGYRSKNGAATEETIKHRKTSDKQSRHARTEKPKQKHSEKHFGPHETGKGPQDKRNLSQVNSAGNKLELQYGSSLGKRQEDQSRRVLAKESLEEISISHSISEKLHKFAEYAKSKISKKSKEPKSSDKHEKYGGLKARAVDTGFPGSQSEHAWQQKTTHDKPSRQLEKDKTSVKSDKTLTPSGDKVEAKPDIKSAKSPANDVTYTVSCKKDKKSRHRHVRSRLPENPDNDAPRQSRQGSQKRPSSYQEFFGMTEINNAKGEYFRTAAQFSQHTVDGAAGGTNTRPRAFCLSQPECAWLNNNTRTSTSTSVHSGARTTARHRDDAWFTSHFVEDDEHWAHRTRGPHPASGKTTSKSKSPKGGRFKRTLMEALNISTFRHA